MENFKIAKNNKQYEIVQGTRVDINGVECFWFKDVWGFNISHVATGMNMAINLLSKERAIEEAKINMTNHPLWLENGIEILKKNKHDYPLNK